MHLVPLPLAAAFQPQPMATATTPPTTVFRTGGLIDAVSDHIQTDRGIAVRGDRVAAVGARCVMNGGVDVRDDAR